MRRFDAVVLGAGPAGSSAAFFLAQSGLSVAVVEKAAFPRRKVCGEFVSATTFPVLDRIGVGEALRQAGGPPTRRVGVFFGSRVATAPMPVADGEQGWGRTLARAVLDPMLLAAAQRQGATVFQPAKGVGLERTEGGNVVRFEREGIEESIEARIVVAAHGSWESGALPTQPPRTDRPSDLLAFKAFFFDATFDDDLMILASFPGGYGGMVHRDRESVGLSFCVRRDVLADARKQYGGTAWDALLRSVCRTNRGIREAIEGARIDAPAKGAGPLRPGFRPPYADSVFRVGNAAGEAHPTIAEGISMAIQSGALLGDCLSPDIVGDPARLDAAGGRYAAAWRSQFGGRIRTADAYARLCMTPAADLAVPLLESLPGILTFGAVLSGKTKGLEDRRWSLNRVRSSARV